MTPHIVFWPPILGATCLIWMMVAPAFQALSDRRAAIESLDLEIAALRDRLIALSEPGLREELAPNLIWISEPGPLTVADAQSALFDLAHERNLELRSVSNTRTSNAGSFRSYEFTLEAEADLSEATSLMIAIEEHRPAFAISDLQIRPIPMPERDGEGTRVFVRLSIWTLGQGGRT